MYTPKTPQIFVKKSVVIFSNRTCSSVRLKKLKSFEDIPGPPNKGLPFFGHLKLLYKKPAGFAKSWQNLKEMRSEYCTKEDKLLRLFFQQKLTESPNFDCEF